MPSIDLVPWVALRTLREKDGQSLRALAGSSGVSVGHLCDLEKGRYEPTPATIKKLAEALNVPMSTLEKHRRDAA